MPSALGMAQWTGLVSRPLGYALSPVPKSEGPGAPAASTIFRIFSSMECALWTVASIVRFWGIIIGRDGRVLLRDLRFVLLGLEVEREFGGLTNGWGEPLE